MSRYVNRVKEIIPWRRSSASVGELRPGSAIQFAAAFEVLIRSLRRMWSDARRTDSEEQGVVLKSVLELVERVVQAAASCAGVEGDESRSEWGGDFHSVRSGVIRAARGQAAAEDGFLKISYLMLAGLATTLSVRRWQAQTGGSCLLAPSGTGGRGTTEAAAPLRCRAWVRRHRGRSVSSGESEVLYGRCAECGYGEFVFEGALGV